MAKAIEFTSVLPLQKQTQPRELKAELIENADAVMATISLLKVAHENQVLDAARGAIGAKNTIFSILGDLGSKPEAINAARNLITLAKALGAIDPDMVSKASANVSSTVVKKKQDDIVPSLWQLLKRANHKDVRRGMSLLLEMAGAVGRGAE
jgi:uncharacterized protein YjgD (DUF1641 family)